MAFELASRVKETTLTTGTGPLTLAGAVNRFRTFASQLANADTCFYYVEGGSDYEFGYGTYNGGILTRTTVLGSSNGGAAVNWPAGTKTVGISDIGTGDLDATNLGRLQGALGISAFIQTLLNDSSAAVALATLTLLGSSGRDNGVVRYDGTVGGQQLSQLNVEDAFTVADDAVASFSMIAGGGLELAWIGTSGGAGNGAPNGMFAFRTGSTYCAPISFERLTNIVLDSSAVALTGTTGVDTNCTIRACIGDQKLYIENRTGASKTFTLMRLKTN